MNRKDFFTKIAGGLLVVPFLPKISRQQRRYEVQTLEHGGWGGDFGPPESRYVTRQIFASKEEAEQFVRSLIPRISKIRLHRRERELRNYELDNVLRSGYRGAIRAIFPTGIQSLEIDIVSRKKDHSYEAVPWKQPLFWSIGTAWGWLANIRVNGQVVSRPSAGGNISQFLIEPFIYEKNIVEYVPEKTGLEEGWGKLKYDAVQE